MQDEFEIEQTSLFDIEGIDEPSIHWSDRPIDYMWGRGRLNLADIEECLG